MSKLPPPPPSPHNKRSEGMQTSGSEIRDALTGASKRTPVSNDLLGGQQASTYSPSQVDKAKDAAKDKAKSVASDGVKKLTGVDVKKASDLKDKLAKGEDVKDTATSMGKDAAVDGAKKSGVAAAKTAGAAAAKPTAIGVGAVAGAIKGWGMLWGGAKALAGSKGAIIAHQTLGAVAKGVSAVANGVNAAWGAVTGAVNGALTGISSALGISATVSGSLPTVAVGVVGVSSVATTVVSTGAFVRGDDEGGCVQQGTQLADINFDGATNASWQVPGSEGYMIAKTIFDHLVTVHGFSGAGAAGAIGNAVRESTLNPQADNPSGGVHGIFQWSGWSHNLNGNRWDAAPNGKDDSLSNQIALMDIELNGGWNRAKIETGNAATPAEAALAWAVYFEGLRLDDTQVKAQQTIEWANWVYTEFEGHKYHPNPILLGSTDVSTVNLAAARGQDTCNTNTSMIADGTGVNPIQQGDRRYYPADALPESLQPFAKDPRDAGLSWGSSQGWWNPGGQCVHLASSYFHAIWEGSPTGIRYASGYMAADSWASAMDGTVSNVPAAGAIMGIPAGANGVYHAVHGHTAVVQHVFENGDILIVETNVPNMSGDNNGQKNTWNYQIMFRDQYVNGNYDFFNPDPNKYTLRFDGWR